MDGRTKHLIKSLVRDLNEKLDIQTIRKNQEFAFAKVNLLEFEGVFACISLHMQSRGHMHARCFQLTFADAFI